MTYGRHNSVRTVGYWVQGTRLPSSLESGAGWHRYIMRIPHGDTRSRELK